MKTRVRRGFTLPEILVTVTVVAVLAAVVVPAVTQYVNKGDTPSTQQDLNQIRNAITAYVADNRAYPSNLYALTVSPGLSTWKGPYLSTSVYGSTAVGTTGTGATVNGSFFSSGLGIVLGAADNGAITQSGGYLTMTVNLTRGTTCQDLYNLDKYIDSGSGTTNTGTATADGNNGNLTWSNTSCTTAASTAPTATLRLMAIGS